MGLIKILKNRRELGSEEFWKRFKEGYQNITPTQLAKGKLNGNVIVILGLVFGIIVNLIIRIENFWYWILLILGGSLLISIFGFIGEHQTYKRLKQQDEIMNKISLEDVEIIRNGIIEEKKSLEEVGIEGIKEVIKEEIKEKINQEDFLDALKGEEK